MVCFIWVLPHRRRRRRRRRCGSRWACCRRLSSYAAMSTAAAAVLRSMIGPDAHESLQAVSGPRGHPQGYQQRLQYNFHGHPHRHRCHEYHHPCDSCMCGGLDQHPASHEDLRYITYASLRPIGSGGRRCVRCLFSSKIETSHSHIPVQPQETQHPVLCDEALVLPSVVLCRGRRHQRRWKQH